MSKLLPKYAKHRHLDQDEILLIQSGTAHVWLGDEERDCPCGGTGVYSVSYLDQLEEHWDRTGQPDIHFLSAWIRRYDAMQFGGGRRNADCDHSGAASRRTRRTCRVRRHDSATQGKIGIRLEVKAPGGYSPLMKKSNSGHYAARLNHYCGRGPDTVFALTTST